MVKTRSDLKGVRVSTKAPRKMPHSSRISASPGRSSRKYEGGNSYFPRETPVWQKEITKFFQTKSDEAGSSRGCCNSDLESTPGSSTSNGNT